MWNFATRGSIDCAFRYSKKCRAIVVGINGDDTDEAGVLMSWDAETGQQVFKCDLQAEILDFKMAGDLVALVVERGMSLASPKHYVSVRDFTGMELFCYKESGEVI